MSDRKKFISGIIVGAVIVLFINLVYWGTSELLDLAEDLGIQLSSKEYESPEDKMEDILEYVDKAYLEDYNKDELYESAYQGLLEGINDPYTVYYNKNQYNAFQENTTGTYEGIGVVVSYKEETKEIMVVSPFIGSPGEKAGLLPGDIIRKVDDKEIQGLSLEEVVSFIKGEGGTGVVLSIYREEEDEVLDIEIIRETISIPTVSHEMLENNIGYIQITGFDEVTFDQFMESKKDLENQNMKGLIIDVRNNPGGLLHIVSAIADELMGEGLIVYTEDKYGNRAEITSDAKKQFNKPLVILVNGNSASASEILAGAIKDSDKGTIIGTTTFGKGLVQRIYELKDGSAIKVTISKYYTPSGKYIHEVGIEPDITVELPEDLKKKLVLEKEEDIQLLNAVEVLSKEIKD